MRYFPLFLDFAGRTALIAGGGEQAAQKARLIGRSEAELVLMSPSLDEELSGLVAAGRARHVPAAFDEAEVDAAYVVFCATEDEALDAAISARVRGMGKVVNVVDKPALCTAITPALVDRDPLVVAIGTEGVAPVMAQRVKTLAESWLEPGLGAFLAELAALRPAMAERDLAPSPRAFWNWIMDGPRARAASGDMPGAVAEVRTAMQAGGVPKGARGGRLSLIALPAEGADLLPLRAVRRMQEADLVAHAPGAPAAALEYARRDAERLAVDPLPLEALGRAVREGRSVAALVPARDWAAAMEAADLAGLGPEGIGAAPVR